MDFHSLTRRELQTLCKKNKIPANITNVAMADALKSLEIVEGIEEIMEPSQSETAKSSIESPTKLEVTSPYVLPSGGRSTRRKHVIMEEPATVKSMNRTRRSTRKPHESNGGANDETPALSSKKENPLKECVDNEKHNVLMTPAPVGVTSRRRRAKDDSIVKRVYSTRRSARLVEKSEKILNAVNDQDASEISSHESLTMIGCLDVKKNLNGGLDDMDESSAVTGVDSSTSSLDDPEECESEVFSTKKQDAPIGEEIKLGSSSEAEKDSHLESEEGCDVAIEVVDGFETVGDLDREPGEVEGDEEHHPDELEVNGSSDKNAEFGFDTQADKDEGKIEVVELPTGESNVMPVNLIGETGTEFDGVAIDTAAELDKEGSREIEAPKSDNMNSNDQSNKTGLVTKAEPDEEKCDKTEDPSGGDEDMFFKFSDEAGNGFDIEGRKEGSREIEAPKSDNMNSNDQSNKTGLVTKAEPDEEKCDKTEDPSGGDEDMFFKFSDEAGNGFDIEAGLDEEKRDETEDAREADLDVGKIDNAEEVTSGEGVVMHLDLNDKVTFNTDEIEKDSYEYENIYSDEVPHLDMVLKFAGTRLQQEGGSDMVVEEDSEIDALGDEQITKTTDPVPANGGQLEDDVAHDGGIKNSATLVGSPLVKEQQHIPVSSIKDEDDELLLSPQIPLSFGGSGFTPSWNSASKPSKTRSRVMTVFSDNKENISSGGKLVSKQERAKDNPVNKDTENLYNVSNRKLAKMLKEKLKIMNNYPLIKDGHGSEGISKPTLQALPENGAVDETSN